MKINPMPVYVKGSKRPSRANLPTTEHRKDWEILRDNGCVVRYGFADCSGDPEIHHALTGAGGRKKHDEVFCLCYRHHRGDKGIHTLSRRVWQDIYGDEGMYLDMSKEVLAEKRK